MASSLYTCGGNSRASALWYEYMTNLTIHKLHAAGSVHLVLESGGLDTIATTELCSLIAALCDQRGPIGAESLVIANANRPPLLECRFFRRDGAPSSVNLDAALCAARFVMEKEGLTAICISGISVQKALSPFKHIWTLETSGLDCGVEMLSAGGKTGDEELSVIQQTVVACGDCRQVVILLKGRKLPTETILVAEARALFSKLSVSVPVIFAVRSSGATMTCISIDPLNPKHGEPSVSGASAVVLAAYNAGLIPREAPISVDIGRGVVTVRLQHTTSIIRVSVCTPVVHILDAKVTWENRKLGMQISGTANVDEIVEYRPPVHE